MSYRIVLMALLTVLAMAMLASPASAGDDFFLVDNINNALYRSNTDNVPGDVLVAILPPAFWAELSPSDQPGHLFAALPNLADIVKLSEVDGAIVDTIATDKPIRNLGYDGSNDVLYGLPQQGSIDLFIVDTDTGMTTNLGFTGIPDSPVSIVGMAFDPVTDLLYATVSQGDLYSIDPTDVSSVLIGNMGLVAPFGIAYNPGDGQMYVTDETTDSLYLVDRNTATITLVGGPYTKATFSTGLSFSTVCLSVISQEVVCHADGTTFTVNIEGLNACTGGTTQVTFTASGGAVGEELCFTVLVNDGGFCCQTTLCTIVPDCGGEPSGDVLIAASASSGQPWIDDVKEKIESTGMVPGNIDTMDIALGIPSLSDLLNYGAVLVFTDAPGAADPIGFGDNLADYVDAGGGVVLQTFYWNLGNGGRFITDGYSPLNTGGQTQNNPMGIGTVHEPGHPVLAGVVSFDGGTSSYHNIGDVAPGAIAIADWEDGRPFAAEMPGFDGRIIGLNFFAPSIDVRDDFWDTASDGALLMANAVNHVMATGVAACLGDLNADGVVGMNDFLDLLSQWGTDPGGPADCDGDDIVGINDVLLLLANWGPCP